MVDRGVLESRIHPLHGHKNFMGVHATSLPGLKKTPPHPVTDACLDANHLRIDPGRHPIELTGSLSTGACYIPGGEVGFYRLGSARQYAEWRQGLSKLVERLRVHTRLGQEGPLLADLLRFESTDLVFGPEATVRVARGLDLCHRPARALLPEADWHTYERLRRAFDSAGHNGAVALE